MINFVFGQMTFFGQMNFRSNGIRSNVVRSNGVSVKWLFGQNFSEKWIFGTRTAKMPPKNGFHDLEIDLSFSTTLKYWEKWNVQCCSTNWTNFKFRGPKGNSHTNSELILVEYKLTKSPANFTKPNFLFSKVFSLISLMVLSSNERFLSATVLHEHQHEHHLECSTNHQIYIFTMNTRSCKTMSFYNKFEWHKHSIL
jgi:hypothetical protein